MKTNFLQKTATKVSDKTLSYSASATAAMLALTSPSVFAASSTGSSGGAFDTAIGADRAATKSMIGGTGNGAAESGLASIYNFIKWVAIVIGLVLAISGLLYVSKAAKSEGQKSQMPGWITFGIGGILTVISIFMFAVGKTAVSVIGAEDTSET